MPNWRKILCSSTELRLDFVLACGQSFRWTEINPGEWRSVLHRKVWTLKQTDTHLLYQVTDPATTKNSTECEENLEHTYETILKDYFQLHVKLTDLYDQWSKADNNFKDVSKSFSGIRMLRQDPVENVFSFICSSNNHISRISGMVERMCEKYGDKLITLEGKTYFAFPTIDQLAKKNVEQQLRELGFGYRAKYIQKSAEFLQAQGGNPWLLGLREKDYAEAKKDLLQLCGVGAKVADCILLMSMDKTGAIPVDTHVWQIAARDYMPKLKDCKSVTEKVYNEIGVYFRSLWGEYAGWAHSVLFSADLKKFKEIEPTINKKDKKRSAEIRKETSKKKKTAFKQ